MKIMLVLDSNYFSLNFFFCFIHCSNKLGSSPNGSPENASSAPSKSTYLISFYVPKVLAYFLCFLFFVVLSGMHIIHIITLNG